MEGSTIGKRTSNKSIDQSDPKVIFGKAGLPTKGAAAWMKFRFSGDYKRDKRLADKFWREGASYFAKLPKKSKRNLAQQIAAGIIQRHARGARENFLKHHADKVYRKLTKNHDYFLRVDELCYAAAKLVPGLVPTKKQVNAESELMQSEKDGTEVDQGIFLSHVLADQANGLHLCAAMLRMKMEAVERMAKFVVDGVADFGPAKVERRGKAAILTINNSRFLNAEDDDTLADTETAADMAIRDPLSEICVLRGGPVDHPRYRARSIFSAGINLTHLYKGKIPFLWYILRDMGVVNKMYRGIAVGDPDEMRGGTEEKPWVAQLETFAIGGGCQYLLAMDYVVAGADAYMTLPARKEGIIPGAANLRLTRFVGARAARQAILMGRRFDCDTPEGRMICDVVVPPGEVEAATMRVCEDFTSSGVVGAASNRRAFRVGEESLDDFRRYMAVYCREQAYCHFSPALIANLEKHWNAANRKI
ncbi:MAG: enoyl-CoA hydratase/isomerase family protein [Pseudolabrys sp.]|nr:enoyl-CoA hydratase/isomerase family protein [Pseudolabrys sp.]